MSPASTETIVITGANRGIGLGLTKHFITAGQHVIAACRRPQDAAALQALRAGDQLAIRALDVTDAVSVAHFAAELGNQVVDVLINNAGVMGGAHQTVDDIDYDAWLETLAVNTLAPLRMALALRPHLRRAKRPRVVTLSSQMGALNRKSSAWYAYRSSKAAVNKVMQALAVDLEADGIIVCPVHPGWVQTDMGGAGADITVDQSSAGLCELIDSLTPQHSGRFWTWDGKEHPW